MSRPHLLRPALATLALAVTTSIAAPEADACGGGWWPEETVDHRVQGIARAEKDLEAGRYDAAAGAILRMIPHIESFSTITRVSLISRAQRVLAVATARKGGKLDIADQIPRYMHGSWLGRSGEERADNIAWAVGALERVAAVKEQDAVAESELAEALAKSVERRAEGKKRLEKLAAADLLTSPEGWAELSSLRVRAGDRKGGEQAKSRCRAMAPDDAICGRLAPEARS